MSGTVQRLERVVESALYVDDLARSWRLYVDVLGGELGNPLNIRRFAPCSGGVPNDAAPNANGTA